MEDVRRDLILSVLKKLLEYILQPPRLIRTIVIRGGKQNSITSLLRGVIWPETSSTTPDARRDKTTNETGHPGRQRSCNVAMYVLVPHCATWGHDGVPNFPESFVLVLVQRTSCCWNSLLWGRDECSKIKNPRTGVASRPSYQIRFMPAHELGLSNCSQARGSKEANEQAFKP